VGGRIGSGEPVNPASKAGNGAGSVRRVDLLPFDEYARSLNRKRVAAGVLYRDERGRVLLVETSYKTEWDIPGGAVEADEPPWVTAVREVQEELGLARPLGRLLAIDFVPTEGVMPEGLAFVWDGGVLSDAEFDGLTLTDPEIRSVRFCTPEEVAELVRPRMAARIAAALDGLRDGSVALCERGRMVTQS
jgi:8-oxo-dGTP pyrophosphatase MutT (NUDIX family)